MKDMKTEQPEQGSAAYKKFRDEDSLRKAYSALEAEFTRKSQQLAAMQRENEENAAWNAELQSFVQCYPNARSYMERIQQELSTKSRQGLTEAYLKILDAECTTPEKLQKDEQFRAVMVQDDGIRKAVITQYLTQVAQGNSPAFAQAGFLPVSKRRQAETLDDAGKMTQGLFK